MSESIPNTPEPQIGDMEVLRGALRNMLEYRDAAIFEEVRSQHAGTPVWIDDPTGHYPLRRQRIGDLCAEVGAAGLVRAYFLDEPHDKHHPGRQFTLKPDNLGAITKTLSPEDIE
ncbi:MAG: hypothetical protein JWP13_326 [Candidatus Saccharibacteria bacterium]|nr:hypothetical protein [Candidatus Saccharibacteria bacterium]